MNEMKKILLIGTGGTIASDVTDSGLAPELTTEQLLSHIPGISDICGVDCLQLLNLDSTNMTPAHWLETVSYTHLVSMKRFETVFPAAGSSNSAVEMTCDELERYASNFAAWVDVCKGWRPEEQG